MSVKNKLFIFFAVICFAIFLVQSNSVHAQTSDSESAKERRDLSRIKILNRLVLDIQLEASKSATSSGVLCNSSSFSFPCTGRSYVDSKSSDGTGWIKVNLSSLIPQLPVDPLNNFIYHYTYCADLLSNIPTFEIDAKLESQKYAPLMGIDHGNDPNLYEVGTNLNLIAPDGGSCTY